MDNYPTFINSESKYKETIENCKSLGDYTKLMEDKILMQSSNMTEKELWSLIQTLSKDILNSQQTIKQVDVQQWIVGFHNLWQTIRHGKHTPTDSNLTDSSSSDSSPQDSSSQDSTSDADTSSSDDDTQSHDDDTSESTD